MEEELGGPLFERTSRCVALTPTGRAVLARGRSILSEVRDFKALAQGTARLFAARLSIGVLPSVGADFMPIANRRLHRLYPELRLVVPSLYALAEAVRDPEFIVRRLDHPAATDAIALHWRRSSPASADFQCLADDLIAVKREIRAARGDRFR